MTAMLAAGYWPSFNVAFFPRVYNLSGYPAFAADAAARGPQYEVPAEWLKYQVLPVVLVVLVCGVWRALLLWCV
jgi:hypothetical protein